MGALYGGLQLSQEYQIPHGNNKKLMAKPARQPGGGGVLRYISYGDVRMRRNC